MTNDDASEVFRAKALESLESALSEQAAARYNSCVNRCYYACFQSAVVALINVGLTRVYVAVSHAFVQSNFEGALINRRKLYSTNLRGTLQLLRDLRGKGDYRAVPVTRREANRAVV